MSAMASSCPSVNNAVLQTKSVVSVFVGWCCNFGRSHESTYGGVGEISPDVQIRLTNEHDENFHFA